MATAVEMPPPAHQLLEYSPTVWDRILPHTEAFPLHVFSPGRRVCLVLNPVFTLISKFTFRLGLGNPLLTRPFCLPPDPSS